MDLQKAKKANMYKLFVCAVMALTFQSVVAQDKGDIVIGMSLPLSGFNAAAGKEGLATATAYFDSVNKAGGIGGRKIALRVLDDEFMADKAAENAKKLVAEKVVAIFNCWGTSSCSAMMPVISEAKIPLVTGIAGGGPMRAQPGRYAFNMRASTDLEIARMVKQMLVIGQNKIALVYQNDAFGKSGVLAAEGVFAKAGLAPLAQMPLERDGANAPAVVAALGKLPGLNGIILVAAPPATVKLIPEARKGRIAAQFYNLSAQANQKVVADLGAHTAGVIFTTLVPSPWKGGSALSEKYRKLMSESLGKEEYSYLGMEVFINASVLVEGLRKAGNTITSESLVGALESAGGLRYGPIDLHYADKDRQGSSYVGLAMIDSRGQFIE